MKLRRVILVSMIWVVMSTATIIAPVFAPPIVRPNPMASVVNVNDIFTVDITVQNVVDMFAWELTVAWNPSRSSLITVSEGPFLSNIGTTFFYFIVGQQGDLFASATLLLPSASASGDGVLLTITFQCIGNGPSSLDLSSTLADSSMSLISHVTLNGNVVQLP